MNEFKRHGRNLYIFLYESEQKNPFYGTIPLMAEPNADRISTFALGPRFSVVGALIFIAVDIAAPSSFPSLVWSDLIVSVVGTPVSLVVAFTSELFAVGFTLKIKSHKDEHF